MKIKNESIDSFSSIYLLFFSIPLLWLPVMLSYPQLCVLMLLFIHNHLTHPSLFFSIPSLTCAETYAPIQSFFYFRIFFDLHLFIACYNKSRLANMFTIKVHIMPVRSQAEVDLRDVLPANFHTAPFTSMTQIHNIGPGWMICIAANGVIIFNGRLGGTFIDKILFIVSKYYVEDEST